MTLKSPPSEQHIRDCLNVHYSMDVKILIRLLLGADRDAAVYRAETSDGSSYFVKLKRGADSGLSISLLRFLSEAGVHAVIPPCQTMGGQLAVCLGDFTLTVSPFVEGEDGFHRDLTGDQWVRLGQGMRQIHALQIPPFLRDKLRRESFSTQWRQAVRGLYPLMESEPTGDPVARDFHTFLKKHQEVIHRLVDRAEGLAQEVQKESYPFVLCHSDLHGGNVLIDQRGNLFIVDWDGPILAPRERDLMFVGAGVAGVWNKIHESELFYEGYGKVEINETLLAYYRHERILEDIAEYAQLLLFSRAGGDERARWYQDFIAQFDPQGVVDIALKTDEDSPY